MQQLQQFAAWLFGYVLVFVGEDPIYKTISGLYRSYGS